MKKISIITPCFNEEANVRICSDAVAKVMREQLPEFDYEHIFSDNASTDSTLQVLIALSDDNPKVKVLANSRNIGPFRNMWSAMAESTGDLVVPLLPADLQDPPSIIPKFVKEWEKGSLVVYGIRAVREEPWLLRMCRTIYYKIISKMASIEVPVNAGEFLLADRKVIDSIQSIDDAYPYIRGMIAKTGVKSSKVSYTWVVRKEGKSKNSVLDLIDQAVNGLVSTSRLPARLVTFLGVLVSSVGFLYAVYTFVKVIINRGDTPVGIPSLIIGVFFLGGLQLISMGILGEYLLSLHAQIRRDPPHFFIEKRNFPKE
jgi:glycosyltransferase involved in cell wall biosynthesis